MHSTIIQSNVFASILAQTSRDITLLATYMLTVNGGFTWWVVSASGPKL